MPKTLQSTKVFCGLLFGVSIVLMQSACVETTQPIKTSNVQDHAPVLMMPDEPVFRSVKPGTPEELLAAEGNWNLVEEGEVYDPSLAHLTARKKVNPKQMKKRDDLIAHFEPDATSGRDGKFRVLKMEPQGAANWKDDLDVSSGYEVAETSIAKPTQKVVGAELVEKIRLAFLQQQKAEAYNESRNIASAEAVAVSNIPIPASKPIIEARAVPVPLAIPPNRNNTGVQNEPDFVLQTENVREVPKTQSDTKKPGILGTLKMALGEAKSPVPRYSTQQQQQQILKVPETRPADQVISSGSAGRGIASLTGFRSAVHEGKTRIAMDLSTSVKYKVAIDHLRNVLRIKLEKTRWQEPPVGTMRASALLGTYVTKAQPDGSTILEIRLKSKAKIADTMILKPDKTAHHRIVIDLQS